MRRRTTVLACIMMAAFCIADEAAADRAFIVQDGRANAEIVIAPGPVRLVKLAAEELQTYVTKITGAELPIVTEPGTETPV